MHRPAGPAVTAGVVASVVGFSSSFVVVLAGLRNVGATAEQATSGLVALCLAQAAGMVWLALRHRQPLALAWSTPGAALLLSGNAAEGGWPAAVGAFVVTGVLVVGTGLVPVLGDLVGRIPVALAQAMLAGVLLPICVEPALALADQPALVAPVVLTWLVLWRPAPRWAVPASLAVALAVIALTADTTVDLLPSLTWTTPQWSWQAVVGLALPLYVVTMASQNVPGVAVMRGLGYRVPWRESLTVTGLGTVAAAPLGGHVVNLAAITAALIAGPEAGPDRERRWPASLGSAGAYVVLAAGAGVVTALVTAAPPGVVESAAGLALLGTLAASLRGALDAEGDRAPATICLVVAASGVTFLGIGAAFWALVAGLVARPLLRVQPVPERPGKPERPESAS
ncbi:benzoate/H(+) symporter BenE family transporter [Nocardioidaceae bacterium]|nr:benzoate/H(+) symporter BenE family transporter [Nocardioidaceae bacterium]